MRRLSVMAALLAVAVLVGFGGTASAATTKYPPHRHHPVHHKHPVVHHHHHAKVHKKAAVHAT